MDTNKNTIALISIITIVAFFLLSLFVLLSDRVKPIEVNCYGDGDPTSGANCANYQEENLEVELTNGHNQDLAVLIETWTITSNDTVWVSRPAFGEADSLLPEGETKEVEHFESRERVVVRLDKTAGHSALAVRFEDFTVTGHQIFKESSSFYELGVQIFGVVIVAGGNEYHVAGHICDPLDPDCD